MLALAATDDRYIYFYAADTDYEDASGFLMKAPKAGGPAQRVPGLEHGPFANLCCVHKGRLFLVVDTTIDDSDPDAYGEYPKDVVALDDSGRLTPILRNRPGLMSLTVTSAGLAWVEGADHDREVPEKLAVFTADLDGRNVRSIWKGSDSLFVGLEARESDLYLFLRAPKHVTPPKSPKGKWLYVRPGTYSTVLRIPRAGGKPQALWRESDLLVSATQEGDDLYVCADGLLKLPAKRQSTGARVGEHCSGEFTVWHGWRLEWERSIDVQPMLFGRIGAGGEMRELFHRTRGGVVMDDQAVYVCVVTADGRRCDLTQIDAAGLEARAKAPAPSAPRP